MACNTLLAYPDFNKKLHIYTDDRNVQLGAFTIQVGRPIGFDSRKLTNPHMRYTVIEKEPLIIVETMKEFRTILLVQ